MSDDGHDSMTPSERRIGVRHFACFPAHLERTGGSRRSAMMHDLSTSGASLVVSTLLAVDDRISLKLYVTGDPDSPSRVTPARVVRVEVLPPEARGLWTHRIAVQFDEPLEGFDDEIKALGERQRKLGLQP
ncbi:MAG TPA: PilZ domain-containing protein [Polyangiaceae bacterium]